MTGETESGGFDAKQARLDNPSGWLKLTRYQTVRLLIDALLESSPGHEFNKTELERRTGVSREAIREHLPLLVEMGVVEEVNESGWPEYKLNDEGKVTKELFELNSAVNSVLAGEPKNVKSTQDKLAEFLEKLKDEPADKSDSRLSDVESNLEDLPNNSESSSSDSDLIEDPSNMGTGGMNAV